MTMGAPDVVEGKVKSGEIKVEHITETINPDDPGYGDLTKSNLENRLRLVVVQHSLIVCNAGTATSKTRCIADGSVTVICIRLMVLCAMLLTMPCRILHNRRMQQPISTMLDKLHTEKMETFHDSPNEPQTNASKSLREQTPEQVAEKARAERLKKVARYDPTDSRYR